MTSEAEGPMSRRPALVIISALVLTAAQGWAQAPAPAQLQNPSALRGYIRQVIQNQLRSDQDRSHYMYRLTTLTKNGVTQTRENIETDPLTVSRLIAENGRPLTPQEKAAEDARLQQFLNSPDQQQKKIRKEKDDQEHTRRLLQSIPDAFIFSYVGNEPGPDGSELVRVTFRPDPNFDPPNHESQVFQGMQGTMWIDTKTTHLKKIDATLFRQVNFGWGILGHLDKGGHFLIEQTRLPTGRWEQTDEVLDFTGKALFFHSISIHEHDTESDFRRVPDRLTLHEGIDMLNRQVAVLAENKPGR